MTWPGTPLAERLPRAGWRETILWAIGRRRRYRVRGASMAPLLADGDEVLAAPRAACRPGDVIVARHPYRTDVHLVKVLEAYDERGHARVVGLDESGSTDSRSFGALPPALLRGRVTCALGARDRAEPED